MKIKMHIAAWTIRYFSISVIVVLFIFIGLQAVSRTNSIDSLKQLLPNASQKKKADIYYSISKSYRSFEVDSSEKYANLGMDYALLANNISVIVDYKILLSNIEMIQGDFSKAFSILDEAGELCKHNKFYEGLVNVKMQRGNNYIKFSDFSSVFKEYREALKIVNENNLIHLKPFVLHRLGFMYIRINDLPNAYNYVKESINIALDNNDNVYYANGLLLLGDIMENPDSSIFYYKKALPIVKLKCNNVYLLPKAYKLIGDFYLNQPNYDLALMYYDSSVVVSKHSHSLNQLATVVTNKAHLYSLKNNYDSTLKYNKQALKIRQSLGDIAVTCASIISIGGNYSKLEKYDSALYYLENGIECSKKFRRIDFLIYGYEKMVELYEMQGDYENAIKYSKLYSKYNDSLVITNSDSRIKFFDSQFELENEKAISVLLENEKNENWIFYLKTFVLLSVFLIIIFYIISVREKKTLAEIEKLSKVIETTNQAVVITNKDNEIVYVNNGLLKIGGYSNKEELVGKTFLRFLDSDSKMVIKNEVLPALAESNIWRGELSYKRKDGLFVVCESTQSGVLFKQNEPEYFVAIFNDITNRKKIENELKNSKEKLLTAIATRDKLFSIIAHDLTGPFSSILGFSKLMATEFDNYNTEDHIRFSQLIYESSKNTFDLLTNLLHWSRSQLGSVELFMEDCDLHTLVAESVTSLKLMLNKKDLTFHNDVSSGVVVVLDINTMSVVIRNLISNAIKFTPQGGIIKVTSQKNENVTDIIVSDTGVGIKSSMVSNLFSKGNNYSESGTDGEKGTGLGLILCKEFVELNKGSIRVESKFGIGSKFIISLQA